MLTLKFTRDDNSNNAMRQAAFPHFIIVHVPLAIPVMVQIYSIREVIGFIIIDLQDDKNQKKPKRISLI